MRQKRDSGWQTKGNVLKFKFLIISLQQAGKTLHIDLYKLKKILNNTRVSYINIKYKGCVCSANVRKDVARSKPAGELPSAACPVSVIK